MARKGIVKECLLQGISVTSLFILVVDVSRRTPESSGSRQEARVRETKTGGIRNDCDRHPAGPGRTIKLGFWLEVA